LLRENNLKKCEKKFSLRAMLRGIFLLVILREKLSLHAIGRKLLHKGYNGTFRI
jgi:hypothetical protein